MPLSCSLIASVVDTDSALIFRRFRVTTVASARPNYPSLVGCGARNDDALEAGRLCPDDRHSVMPAPAFASNSSTTQKPAHLVFQHLENLLNGASSRSGVSPFLAPVQRDDSRRMSRAVTQGLLLLLTSATPVSISGNTRVEGVWLCSRLSDGLRGDDAHRRSTRLPFR